MSYRWWLIIAGLLFSIGLVSGLLAPSSIARLAAGDIAQLLAPPLGQDVGDGQRDEREEEAPEDRPQNINEDDAREGEPFNKADGEPEEGDHGRRREKPARDDHGHVKGVTPALGEDDNRLPEGARAPAFIIVRLALCHARNSMGRAR